MTAREHELMRGCIERIRRLGIRDRRLTNLTDRMSVTLKRAARRADKSVTTDERPRSATVGRRNENRPASGTKTRNEKE